jgi:hypothetical protein
MFVTLLIIGIILAIADKLDRWSGEATVRKMFPRRKEENPFFFKNRKEKIIFSINVFLIFFIILCILIQIACG